MVVNVAQDSGDGQTESRPGDIDEVTVLHDFVDIAHRVVWCTIATVDLRGRPRSRVLHPLWEVGRDGSLIGWVTTRTTPVKVAHLAGNPWVSCSYWNPDHDTAVAECRAQWETDLDQTHRIWQMFRATPAPLGHDPWAIWPDGPASPDAGLLRLQPWLIVTRRLAAMVAGDKPRTWRPT
jgi:hypothetical protein